MIIAEQAHLRVASATHPGMRGKSNEDRYLVTAYRSSSAEQIPSVLAILADGIGGHRAGEVAAQLAIDNINKYVANSPLEQPAQVLQQALGHTNQLILNFANANPALAGMGTTCVVAWIIEKQLYAASVGDSRLYLLRSENLIRLTTDHTWIQEALSHGSLTPEQVKGHPNAHIIRRYLGSMSAINPDLRLRLSLDDSDVQAEANQGMYLFPGDRLMLCSDGLTDLVLDTEILDILRSRNFEQVPSQLIDIANQRGGHDNTTVVVMEIPQPEPDTRPAQRSSRTVNAPLQNIHRSTASWWMIGLLTTAIVSLVLLLLYLVEYKPF